MNDAEKAISDENTVNDEKVEVSWAIAAFEFAEDFSKLLNLLENPEELHFGDLFVFSSPSSSSSSFACWGVY